MGCTPTAQHIKNIPSNNVIASSTKSTIKNYQFMSPPQRSAKENKNNINYKSPQTAYKTNRYYSPKYNPPNLRQQAINNKTNQNTKKLPYKNTPFPKPSISNKQNPLPLNKVPPRQFLQIIKTQNIDSISHLSLYSSNNIIVKDKNIKGKNKVDKGGNGVGNQISDYQMITMNERQELMKGNDKFKKETKPLALNNKSSSPILTPTISQILLQKQKQNRLNSSNKHWSNSNNFNTQSPTFGQQNLDQKLDWNKNSQKINNQNKRNKIINNSGNSRNRNKNEILKDQLKNMNSQSFKRIEVEKMNF